MTLSPNGPVQLIGEEYMVMSFSGEGLADEVVFGALDVGVVEAARDPVGEVGVRPTVEVEVGQLHRPGPVGVRQPRGRA